MDKKALEKALSILQRRLSRLIEQEEIVKKEIDKICNKLYK